MKREKALTPIEFADAVADYSHSSIDETYVRKCYEAQISAVRYGYRDPLDPREFVAALVVNGGVDVTDPDRDRLQEAYEVQIDTATQLAGDSRV